jgi:hypothetical protein
LRSMPRSTPPTFTRLGISSAVCTEHTFTCRTSDKPANYVDDEMKQTTIRTVKPASQAEQTTSWCQKYLFGTLFQPSPTTGRLNAINALSYALPRAVCVVTRSLFTRAKRRLRVRSAAYVLDKQTICDDTRNITHCVHARST